VTDTPDFIRRSHQKYPEHGNRFTGEPAYFHHVISAATFLMNELGLSATDFSAAVFHQPNARFPRKAAEMLGFTPQQIKAGLLSPQIGNTYAGAALLGMTAILDEASPGDRILMVSFGSGAGSDAFSFRVTENIKNVRHLSPTTQDYIRRKSYVDYATYARWRKKIVLY
ncbi:MAG: hydroxymethylglutaryl-CoA synthase, partial [Calditrichaeota bacterium]